MSRRVTATLGGFAERLENYSIDESFLEFSHGPDFPRLGASIKTTVRKHTGIPVSVGFGPTKVLAKLANKAAKRGEGVFVVPDSIDKREEWLKGFGIRDVWGMGRQQTAKMESIGVKSAYDLAHLEPNSAKKLLTVVGARIVMELGGVSCLSLEEIAPAKKAICSAKSFGKMISSLEELSEPLVTYTSRVAEKLRAQGSVCGHVRVFLETNPFLPLEPQFNPCLGMDITPTNFTPALCAAADNVLRKIYRKGYSFKKVGVMLLEITPERETQLCFDSLPATEVDRRRKLMSAMDALNQKFGRGTLRVASAGVDDSPWRMRQDLKSRNYTTKWADIPEVAA